MLLRSRAAALARRRLVNTPQRHMSTFGSRLREPGTSISQPSRIPFFNSSKSGPLLRRSYANGYYGSDPTYTSAKWAVRIIIGLNAAVFLTWQYAATQPDRKLLRWLEENFQLSALNLKAGRYWTLLTSAFSHINLAHFAFNMIALRTFGSILTATPGVGAVHIVCLGAGSAVLGSNAWLRHSATLAPAGDRRFGPNAVQFGKETQVVRAKAALGASGMVMGVGAAATLLQPFTRMMFMIIPIPIPLYAMTGIYILMDAYLLDSGGRIGHAAHLGGSIFGALYYFAFLRRFGGVWWLRFARLR